MKRKKKAVYRFMHQLENLYGVKFPPTLIAWKHPALCVNGEEVCFGVSYPNFICVAGKLGKKWVMELLAHEFYHHMYHTLGGADYTEEQEEGEAHIFANCSVSSYYADIKIRRWKRKGWECEL